MFLYCLFYTKHGDFISLLLEVLYTQFLERFAKIQLSPVLLCDNIYIIYIDINILLLRLSSETEAFKVTILRKSVFSLVFSFMVVKFINKILQLKYGHQKEKLRPTIRCGLIKAKD